MEALRMGVIARPTVTKVVVTCSEGRAVLKALLPSVPMQRESLPWLGRALSRWVGQPVRAALIADERSTTSDRTVWRDVAQRLTVVGCAARLVIGAGVEDLESGLPDDIDRPETFDEVVWFLDRWVAR